MAFTLIRSQPSWTTVVTFDVTALYTTIISKTSNEEKCFGRMMFHASSRAPETSVPRRIKAVLLAHGRPSPCYSRTNFIFALFDSTSLTYNTQQPSCTASLHAWRGSQGPVANVPIRQANVMKLLLFRGFDMCQRWQILCVLTLPVCELR